MMLCFVSFKIKVFECFFGGDHRLLVTPIQIKGLAATTDIYVAGMKRCGNEMMMDDG